ncbi:MAG: SMI1/KNR4 family protein [Lachnospiraceae bacterium]|nr:SMI1/KNR4 family protein [Lachnospiraceae bacterium]MDE7415693.1 SMI1/KNR4 family protein [Lachnospiraceae bacterium]
MKTVKDYFSRFYTEIGKYKQGIHVLNDGISEAEINDFEIKYHIYLPFYYREWLKMNNGGELFLPGTVLYQIQGNEEYEVGTSYVEYNFDPTKRWPQMPNYLFIIAKICTGDAVGFDLRKTNKSDGVIIYWDHETGRVSKKWNSLAEWLDYEMEGGKMLVNYDGSESDYFNFLNE